MIIALYISREKQTSLELVLVKVRERRCLPMYHLTQRFICFYTLNRIMLVRCFSFLRYLYRIIVSYFLTLLSIFRANLNPLHTQCNFVFVIITNANKLKSSNQSFLRSGAEVYTRVCLYVQRFQRSSKAVLITICLSFN